MSAQSGVFVCSVWSFCLQKSAVFWSEVHESVRYVDSNCRLTFILTADCQTPSQICRQPVSNRRLPESLAQIVKPELQTDIHPDCRLSDSPADRVCRQPASFELADCQTPSHTVCRQLGPNCRLTSTQTARLPHRQSLQTASLETQATKLPHNLQSSVCRQPCLNRRLVATHEFPPVCRLTHRF